MIHYKITDGNGWTKNNTQWGENITHEITKPGTTLCSDEVFHGYETPEIAIFMNPAHGNYDEKTMLLWEAKGTVVAGDGMKLGFKRQTTIKQVEKPIITAEQRVEIAILCTMKVIKNRQWRKWARNWITGTDRTVNAINAINGTNAVDIANAVEVAYAATYAINAVKASNGTNAATYASNAAAFAAFAAYAINGKINISRIIKSVITIRSEI